MAKFSSEDADVGRTLDATEFGTSLKDLSAGDLSRGWSDADVEEGFERNNNDGLETVYESPREDIVVRGMRAFGPNYTEEEYDPGMLERPGIGYSKSNVRRN